MKGIRIGALALILVAMTGNAALSSGTVPVGTVADTEHAFTLRIPGDFTAATDPKQLAGQSYFPLTADALRLAAFYSGRAYDGTNFGSACIVVNAVPAKEDENGCARFEGDTLCGPGQDIRDIDINGVRFKHAVFTDAAMGHRLETREYWTIRDGLRYEIQLCLSYTDIHMYPEGEKREFDRQDCRDKLTGILETFSFTSPAGTAAD